MRPNSLTTQTLKRLNTQTPLTECSTTFKTGLQLFLLLAMVFVYSSCQKDSLLKSESISQDANENPHARYLRDSKLNNAISNRGDKYTYSEALDYLNDGMNFLYCRPADYFLETVVFKDTFTVPVASEQIDIADLINLMDGIAEFAGDHYWAEVRSEKEPFMFDHHLLGTSTSPDYVHIEAIFAMEAGSVTITTDEYPYEDSWLYARWFEDENEECNEEETSETSTVLFRRDLRKNVIYRNQEEPFYLINPIATCFDPKSSGCLTNHGIPLIGIPITEYFGSELLDNPNDAVHDNLFDYLLFLNFSGFDDFFECLEVDEMNFYYESMEELAFGLLPSPAGDNVIVQIEVGWDRYIVFNSTTIWHPMIVIRATKVSTDEENVSLLPCCP